MQIEDVKREKALLRKRYLKLRNSWDSFEKKTADERIAEELFSLEEYKNSDVIYAYASKGSEVDTLGIIARALADNKRVALPRCAGEGKMDFYFVASLSDLEPGAFGVYEPKSYTKAAEELEGLCLVPGLLFCKNGARLGYGKGFYDRFLPRFKGVSAGLCANAFLIDAIPAEPTDYRVDMVITDNGVYNTVADGPRT